MRIHSNVISYNDIMEFDHVIRVHADGSVTDADPGIYAPEVLPDYPVPGQDHISGYPFGYDYETGKPKRDVEWSLMRGYTGQYRCAGSAHMHNSEAIGGRMERDILANPGLYVAVVLHWPCGVEYGCDAHESEIGDCQTDHVEGWTVAYVLDEDLAP